MSLAIQVARVVRVKIGSQWYMVEPGSFNLDAYEFVEGEATVQTVHNGGAGSIYYPGFVFTDHDTGLEMYGPLTAIDAVATA
jgi:hypothetical protein